MAIKIICECGKKFSAEDEFARRKVKCPACGQVLNLSKAVAEKLSPKDQRDFEDFSNDDSDDGQAEVPERASGVKPSAALESAPSQGESNGDQTSRQEIRSEAKPPKPLSPEMRAILWQLTFDLRNTQASKVRAGVSCYFFGFLLIFFGATYVLCAPTLHQGDLVTFVRVIRGVGYANLIAEVFITVGFGLCLTVPSKMRGRDILLVAVIGGFLSLLISAMTQWNVLFSLRVGRWLPQFVLLTAHASFFLFLRWLGEFLDRSEITRRANRVLVLMAIGSAIWLGVFRGQQPMPFMLMRNPMLTLLSFAYGILALIGLFSVIRLLSRCREILRTDERAAADTNAVREIGADERESKWLSRSDVLKLAIGGSLVAVSLWSWVTLLKPAPNAFPFLAGVPGGPTVVTSPGKKMLVLKGHTGMIVSVAFSPDWKRLATASWDKTVKVWDAASGKEIHTLNGHSGIVQRVVFSPDGKRLASASHDMSVKIWDAVTGRETLTLNGHTALVTNVAFSPDGKTLASTAESIKVWDTTSGQELQTLTSSMASFLSVAFSPDGKRLAAGSGEINVWDTTSWQQVLTLKGHIGVVWGLAFSPDGKQLASGGFDTTVRVWDAVTGQETQTLKGHSVIIQGVAFRPDGKRLASNDTNGAVKEWNPVTGQLMSKSMTSSALGLTFSPDGKRMGAASPFGTVEIVDVVDRPELPGLKGHTGTVTSVAFSLDGQRIVSGSTDQTVRVWDSSSGQETLSLIGHNSAVKSVAYSPDGKWLASLSGLSGELKVWDASSGLVTHTLKADTGGVFASVAFSPDGKRLASALWDKTVKVWDPMSGLETMTLKGHLHPVASVAFSPDGKWIVSGSGALFVKKPDENEVKLWDATTGLEKLTLKAGQFSIKSVAASHDGKRLAAATFSEVAKMWDASSGQELFTLKATNSGQVNSVAFSPDGQWMAAAGGVSTGALFPADIKLWNVTNGQVVRTLKSHAASVESIAFSPDGKRLVSGSMDETIRVWDTTTGRELLMLGAPPR